MTSSRAAIPSRSSIRARITANAPPCAATSNSPGVVTPGSSSPVVNDSGSAANARDPTVTAACPPGGFVSQLTREVRTASTIAASPAHARRDPRVLERPLEREIRDLLPPRLTDGEVRAVGVYAELGDRRRAAEAPRRLVVHLGRNHVVCAAGDQQQRGAIGVGE